MAAIGIPIFAVGLAKKTMIADPLGALASPYFDKAFAGEEIHFLSLGLPVWHIRSRYTSIFVGIQKW